MKNLPFSTITAKRSDYEDMIAAVTFRNRSAVYEAMIIHNGEKPAVISRYGCDPRDSTAGSSELAPFDTLDEAIPYFWERALEMAQGSDIALPSYAIRATAPNHSERWLVKRANTHEWARTSLDALHADSVEDIQYLMDIARSLPGIESDSIRAIPRYLIASIGVHADDLPLEQLLHPASGEIAISLKVMAKKGILATPVGFVTDNREQELSAWDLENLIAYPSTTPQGIRLR